VKAAGVSLAAPDKAAGNAEFSAMSVRKRGGFATGG